MENPQAALLAYWAPLHRQVSIEGPVRALSPSQADTLFSLRPVKHQLGAIASEIQSHPIPDRQV